jgi:hypothetical protein
MERYMARTERDGRAEPAGDLPPSRLRVLRFPAFRWFFTGQFASAFGDYLVGPALAFAVLDLTGSPGDIGLVLAARTVPILAFMLLGGVLADRLRRHRGMIGADLVRAAPSSRWPSVMCANSRRVTPEAVEKICGQRVDPAGLRSTRT